MGLRSSCSMDRPDQRHQALVLAAMTLLSGSQKLLKVPRASHNLGLFLKSSPAFNPVVGNVHSHSCRGGGGCWGHRCPEGDRMGLLRDQTLFAPFSHSNWSFSSFTASQTGLGIYPLLLSCLWSTEHPRAPQISCCSGV